MPNETNCPECGISKYECKTWILSLDGERSIKGVQHTTCATIQALRKENEEKDNCLGKIMDLCIGEVEKGHKMDGVEIGQMIYDVIGRNAEQFSKNNKEKECN